jgi:ribosomal protein L13
MLPKNKLRKKMLARLKLVVGNEHNFKAQQPETISL